MAPSARKKEDPLALFHAPTRAWFESSFAQPTPAQRGAWKHIAGGRSTLLVAPTGSGKTLAAFLAALDRSMFSAEPDPKTRCRILYVSPLKALAVDVDRNLRAPLAGISAAAARMGVAHRLPEVAIRSGDTDASVRARIARRPPDILITTPESLYLMLTSNAREGLVNVETVIIDEIHAVVGTKRGSHLALTLERLERLRAAQATQDSPVAPLVRIGLSATQRPLEEVARFLGGADVSVDASAPWIGRPVEIVDARADKALELSVEVPVEDMGSLGEAERGPLAGGPTDNPAKSIWTSIHPRLVELVRAHRSTMVFANSRRLAERLAAAINEEAGEDLARAHHGSVAREEREIIEEALKAGTLPCIVATSSLELGLDLGAVDLVVQVEAPPSIASGLQRVGRAGHHVGGTSTGVVMPKHRGDLLAAAACAKLMRAAQVEATHYPRNPLDVLSQHIVAIASMDPIQEPELFALVRSAAPFADLSRGVFEGVLDMLSGRYPADDFAELRPRINWDRITGTISARQGAKRLAVLNAGTIPDRGLYGVFMADAGDGRTSRRVGELDEEMVFEAREGDVFVLGASSWRMTEITHDRVLVVPAPGEPGRMPFWKGEALGRSRELGDAIGALTRTLARGSADKAKALLQSAHDLDELAADNLVRYVREQAEATGEVPSDKTIVVERFADELGDVRVCIMAPFGTRLIAPLTICIAERCRTELGLDVEHIYTDDGIVLRFPEGPEPPDASALLPHADEVEELLMRCLGGTALFASRFRECAGRALLLPRRRPGKRAPLWQQRKKAADLLAVASKFPSFPIVLETHRECLSDVFDVPGLIELLKQIESRQVRIVTVDTQKPSPFASTLLFTYVGTFLYEGDAPLSERRAQALALDTTQLRELLGQIELRDLLDPDSVLDATERLQRRDGRYPIESADGLHDLLLLLGELSREELAERVRGPDDDAPAEGGLEGTSAGLRAAALVQELLAGRRAIEVRVAGALRIAAAEDASRYRDALGVVPPLGVPLPFLEPVADPLGDLVSRWARTHGPFRVEELAARWGMGVAPLRAIADRMVAAGRLVEGELTPGARGMELCDADVLRAIKRRSLARLRAEVEPVEPEALSRFAIEWQGIAAPRRGPDALFAAVEQLQGAPIPASSLEAEVLPGRVLDYHPRDLDELTASGELVWRGLEAASAGGGRIGLFVADSYPLLAPPIEPVTSALAADLRAKLSERGALFFAELCGELFPADVLAALWELVWAGEVTNDTLAPLRSLASGDKEASRSRRANVRGRRRALPGSEGRWSLLPAPAGTETERRAALTRALLERHGLLTREAVQAEGVVGGFGTLYPVLRAMEDAGRVRRGLFVAGLGAAQFALPGADDRLRALREPAKERDVRVLAATDPAQPWGAALRWPEHAASLRPRREAGAIVVLVDGALVAWMGRSEKSLLTFLPSVEPARSAALGALIQALGDLVDGGRRRGLLLATLDGEATHASPLAPALARAGWVSGLRGYLRRPKITSTDARAMRRPSRSFPTFQPAEPQATLDDEDFDAEDLDAD